MKTDTLVIVSVFYASIKKALSEESAFLLALISPADLQDEVPL